MKNIIIYISFLFSVAIFAQDKTEDKKLKKQQDKALNYVADANDFAQTDAFVDAEMEYRKALSLQPTQVAGAYNLGHQYYKKGNYEEALYRNQQALKSAATKTEKHRAFHNIGNILMEEKKCKDAVEAYKNALRNNPKDNETRYNLGLAKECAKNEEEPPQEEDKDGDDNKNKDKNEDEDKKENNEDEQEDKDKKDEGDKDKKEGDKDKDEEGKPKDEKEQDGKEGDQKNEQKQPQPGQMSPQQIKNLLEAMENQEQKVQEKINAEKVKGAKVQTDKDW